MTETLHQRTARPPRAGPQGRLRPQPLRGRRPSPTRRCDDYVVTAAARRRASTTPWASSRRPSTRRNSKAATSTAASARARATSWPCCTCSCSTTPARAAPRAGLERVCVKHDWVRGQEVPARAVPHDRRPEHGVGHPGGYVDHVRQLHPERPAAGRLPGRRPLRERRPHRASAGRREVLRAAQPGRPAAATAGASSARRWDAARVRGRAGAPRPASDARSRLVGDLVQHLFPAYQGVAGGKDEAVRRRSTRA